MAGLGTKPFSIQKQSSTDWWTLGVIVGLAGVTVLTRCFFFILDRPWGLPDWAHRALHYAPIAALAAVVIPEVVMTGGHLGGAGHGLLREPALRGVQPAPAALPLSLIHI